MAGSLAVEDRPAPCRAATPAPDVVTADVAGRRVRRAGDELDRQRRPGRVAVEAVQVGAAQAAGQPGHHQRSDHARDRPPTLDGQMGAGCLVQAIAELRIDRAVGGDDDQIGPLARRAAGPTSHVGAARRTASAAASRNRRPSSAGMRPPGAASLQPHSPVGERDPADSGGGQQRGRRRWPARPCRGSTTGSADRRDASRRRPDAANRTPQRGQVAGQPRSWPAERGVEPARSGSRARAGRRTPSASSPAAGIGGGCRRPCSRRM